MRVRGCSVVAEVRDEEGLSVDDDDPAGFDVVDSVKGRNLLRSGIIQTLREDDFAKVDIESSAPSTYFLSVNNCSTFSFTLLKISKLQQQRVFKK